MLYYFSRNTRIISISFPFRFYSCVCMCVYIPLCMQVFYIDLSVRVCAHGCRSTWRLEVHASNHPWPVFSLIQWGRTFQVNLELTGIAGLISQLTLWVLSLSSDIGSTGGLLSYHHLCIFWDYELWSCLFVTEPFPLALCIHFLRLTLITYNVLLEVRAYICPQIS